MSIKKVETVKYIGEDEHAGFEFNFEPVEASITIEKGKHGYTARYLVQDDQAEGPNGWGDNNLFLVAYHRYFSVDGPRVFSKLPEGERRSPDDKGHLLVERNDARALALGKKESEEQGLVYPDELAKKYHFFGLEAYIHSGVSLALSYEGNFPDRRWDVSQLGLVFVAKEEWKTRKKAHKAAEGLIEEWNQYLSGDVYGIVREDYNSKKERTGGDECWGYYGYEYAIKAVKTEI